MEACRGGLWEVDMVVGNHGDKAIQKSVMFENELCGVPAAASENRNGKSGCLDIFKEITDACVQRYLSHMRIHVISGGFVGRSGLFAAHNLGKDLILPWTKVFHDFF